MFDFDLVLVLITNRKHRHISLILQYCILPRVRVNTGVGWIGSRGVHSYNGLDEYWTYLRFKSNYIQYSVFSTLHQLSSGTGTEKMEKRVLS
jgi:hypothetical protein